MEMAIHLRPENIATVLDVIEMRRQISQYHKRLEEHILRVFKSIQHGSIQTHVIETLSSLDGVVCVFVSVTSLYMYRRYSIDMKDPLYAPRFSSPRCD